MPTFTRSNQPTVALTGSRASRRILKEIVEKAYANLCASLSYHGVDDELLHRRDHPPFLWVMLIAPREIEGVQSRVYERIAVGRIYLKRWVEASPVFEILVLA